MRISNEELRRITDYGSTQAEKQGGQMFSESVIFMQGSVVSALESRDIKMIGESLTQIPDTRDQIVASLKERIESGTYRVSSEHIAEMMVRRAVADRMH